MNKIVRFEYEQSTGRLFAEYDTGKTDLIGIGYSGNGKGLNNPDMQDVPKVGLAPRGPYIINLVLEQHDNHGDRMVDSMSITPQFKTVRVGSLCRILANIRILFY